jgi:RNA polymerase sigma-70 factor (ECF subfamily)
MTGPGDGDELLIRSVYAEHGRAMRAYANRLLGDPAAAEDIVQEALVRVWRHPEVVHNGKGSLRGWLLTVVRNLIIDQVRARAARPREVAELPSDAQPPQRDHAETVSNSVTLAAAMAELSPDHRSVINQLYFEERNLREAAAALGVPAGTVKSRSYYAVNALREVLARRAEAR